MIKAVFKTSLRPLSRFNHFVMGVSVGSPNQTGEALAAVVRCINASGLQSGLVVVSDLVKRYSYRPECDEAEATARARADGDFWLRDNAETLETFAMPVEIVRWERYLSDPRFPDYLARFERAHDEVPALKGAVNDDVAAYLHRTFNDAACHNAARRELGVRFYLEELAVMSIYYEDNPGAEFYPGKGAQCVKCVRDGLVPGVPRGILDTQLFRINVYDDPANDNDLRRG